MSSLHLDPRQRAMLADMGVRLWLPDTLAAPAQLAARPAAAVTSAPEAAAPAVQPAPAAQPMPATAPAGHPDADEGPAWPDDGDGASVPADWPPMQAQEADFYPVAPPPASTHRSPVARPLAVVDPVALQPRPDGIDQMDWPALQTAVASCQACALCQGRTQPVFGVGDTRADWLVVGEAPGEQEDLRGEPFVGPSGQLLDNMLKAIALSRHAHRSDAATAATLNGVYIANVIKCRPPGNRNPQPAEVAQCEPYLARQVALLRPKIILALGRFAVQSLLKTNEPIGKLRGRVHHYEGVPVIVSYHPAYLLRNLPDKAKAWADLCLALDVAGGSAA